ncbi:heat-inducible transcription repressor HrcA [Clostridium tepidiprofundi DSM 19306]|uniref:Heat-inducible transcription repressor HrcA n=1 Tax=Clostridium tepidiprofundi DSM 19306 TaxID=1121338 RepID=A0A151B3L6_9CLOT|nr:heat-inducible transcriptional repressor HrcA [Clostridium tepidiprofundi]KYH34519.1 heat-inducible transcription repressor HrcA [Clostridium tepidiprofundi DSM 19306]
MNERKIRILEAIINDYIQTGEPVGSRTIAKKYNLGISSATIRNEMADLEELGYIEHIHSSSGRIPSDLGYRLYVDELMKVKELSLEEELIIKSKLLSEALYQIDKIVERATSLLSDLTKLACIVKAPSMKKSFVKCIQLLKIDSNNVLVVIVTDSGIIKNNVIRISQPVDRINLEKLSYLLNMRLKGLTVDDIDLEVINNIKNDFVGHDDIFNALIPTIYDSLKSMETPQVYSTGETNIFNYNEYNDVEKARAFLELINNQDYIKDLLENSMGGDNKLSIIIGEENKIEEAKDCSIISAVYSVKDRPLGVIGVIGPKRIRYDKIVPLLNEFINELNRKLNDIYYDY